MSDLYGVRRIISSKKEKGKTYYLVDWVPSYTEAANIPKVAIDEYKNYKNGATIIGPYEPSTKNRPKKDWKWVVQLGEHYEIIPYEEVSNKFKDELIQYFLDQATIGTTDDDDNNDN